MYALTAFKNILSHKLQKFCMFAREGRMKLSLNKCIYNPYFVKMPQMELMDI